MKKKYQVFVSSTYEDLRDERRKVLDALLEDDFIPAGMELFPAGDDGQWDVIERVIADCDYYVVIIAGRYGSLTKEGISFTEKEYDLAVKLGVPVAGFVHSKPASLGTAKQEVQQETQGKLAAFVSKVKSKICKHWQSGEELARHVCSSVRALVRDRPRPGYVRSEIEIDENFLLRVNKDLQRLRQLEAQVSNQNQVLPPSAELAWGKDVATLSFNWHWGHNEGTTKIQSTWDDIFEVVAPWFVEPTHVNSFGKVFAECLPELIRKSPTKLEEIPPGMLSFSSLTPESMNLIKVQLIAMGMLQEESGTPEGKRSYSYELSSRGREYLFRLVAQRRS